MRITILIVLVLSAMSSASDLQLWYKQPAAKWEEALPVGSGRLGAMVFGGTSEERIQFNEDTLWTGKPHDYVRAGARDHLAEIRKLAFAGLTEKDPQAGMLHRLVKEKFLSDPVRQKAYQPFGDLKFSFGHKDVTDYRRSLDLDTAIGTTMYKSGGVTYTREVFASHPDNVIVVRITADKPGSVSFSLKMDTPHKNHQLKSAGKEQLILTGQVVDPKAGNAPGMKFASHVAVRVTGGTNAPGSDDIRVANADSATILLVAATDFVNWQDISGDPAQRCLDYFDKLGTKTYDAIKADHIADHQKLFRRVAFDIGKTDRAELPTDERLKQVKDAAKAIAGAQKEQPKPDALPKEGLDRDPAFAALFFQYGRYLLIASSRPGDEPANLQGVWNELLDPPWESKFTTNINFEMNYWHAEQTNVAECHEPLFDIVDDLRVSGARTAEKLYGCKGWVLHHNTDHWRGTAPINNVDGLWPTGGAWLCHHLWDHWLYSGDKEFLAKRAYPAMKEACEFFLDFLVEDPKTGWLVTCPSHSPEQTPPERALLTYAPTMDNQLIRALFGYTIEATEILGVDSEFAEKIRVARKRIPPNQIGKAGQLQEWIQDWDAPNNNHRHMSPLWGLYPGWDITPADAKVFDAAKLLLKWRGDGSTGWSFAWRIPLWARVHDGEYAYRQFHLQLAKRTLPNLFDLCGPFQIDGNFGATAGVAEMLLQSHIRPTDDRNLFLIEPLPALPSAWPKGSITGLRARGGFEVDMNWDGGKLTKVVLRSKLGNPCRLRYGASSKELKTEPGKSYEWTP